MGSIRHDLHIIALNIFNLRAANNIDVDIQWIPRNKLEKADFISRIIDIDDWQISHGLFCFLDNSWGLHTVDCFSNYYNCKLPRFFSRYWNPGCAGVDFFVQSLEGENCLVVPPVCLIVRAVINYLFLHKAVATVIVPFWPSSYFWPIISRKFYNFIVDYKLFLGRNVLEHGRDTNSLSGSERFHGHILAIRMDLR